MSNNYVDIFTDGASKGDPGVGGWGALVVIGEREYTLWGGSRMASALKMEVMAAIRALAFLKRPSHVNLVTDAKYLVDIASNIQAVAAAQWRAEGFRVRESSTFDWLRREMQRHRSVKFYWVPGHSGHYGNERAHALAQQGVSRQLDKMISGDQPAWVGGLAPPLVTSMLGEPGELAADAWMRRALANP